MKARELGFCTTGTVDELRERLAAHYRAKLVLPDLVGEQEPEHEQPVEQEGEAAPPHKAPSRIRQYLTPPPPPKSPEQIEAERSVIAWCQSSTAAEAAQRLGRSVRSVASFAGYLHAAGVPLMKLPTHCGPLVRNVLGMVPSVN